VGTEAELLEGDLRNGLGGQYSDYIKVRLLPTGKTGKVSRHLVKLKSNKPPTAPPPSQPKPLTATTTTAPPPRAHFVSDVTIVDGTVLAPGARFEKVWRLKNSDPKQPWPVGTRLTNVGGSNFGCSAQGVLVPIAGPGEVVDVKVNLVAPFKKGRATGYWRLITPGGQKFGHRIWIDVCVDKNLPVPPQPALPAPTETTPYDLQLQLLQGMGFADRDACLASLTASGGNIQAAVARLLE